jgi:hypothetical protein
LEITTRCPSDSGGGRLIKKRLFIKRGGDKKGIEAKGDVKALVTNSSVFRGPFGPLKTEEFPLLKKERSLNNVSIQ